MSKKAVCRPARVWAQEFKADAEGKRWAFMNEYQEDDRDLYISAASLRELCEALEADAIATDNKYAVAGVLSAVKRIKQLLEGPR